MGIKVWQNLMASIVFLLMFQALFSDQSKNKITLKWETPESGTAVSVETEEEYLRQPPVLFSEKDSEAEVVTEINMDIATGGLILPGSNETDAVDEKAENDLGRKVALKAKEFFDKKITTVNVNGSILNIERDCSHFVRAAYWEASGHTIDLFRESIATGSANPRTATGVILISQFFRKNHRYQNVNPKEGDVIVFDNTYDKNNNKKRDDYYTHVGIVSAIREDNTIEFYHGNIARSIKKGYINFNYKDTSTRDNLPVNSYIRPRYSWETNSKSSLASYLVRSFAGY